MLSQLIRTARGHRAYWPGLILVCCLYYLPTVQAKAPPARVNRERFHASLKEMHEAFASKMEELAASCEANNLALEAEEIRELAKPLDPNVLQGENLPREIQHPIPDSLPPAERAWRQKLRTYRTEYAAKLFTKAKAALDGGMISLAYELVREVARQDPDHKFARQLLGYKRYREEWVTIYSERMLRENNVYSPQFGWLKKDHLLRYQNGERFYNGQWMTARREAESRRDFDQAWVVRTDHYEIHTNHSLEMGVALGKHLEDFYRIFFQTFAGFLTKREELGKLFAGNAGRVPPVFVVNYYRSKDEYVVRLRPRLGRIVEGTSGLYLSGDKNNPLPQERIAHFYHNTEASEEERLATMFHEATHQLFAEAYTSNPKVGVDSDFWVIEGIACYMESFQRKGDNFSLGDPRYIRFQNAQYRLLSDNYYVPLQELCSLGLTDFQSDPNISKNYSQGAGLAHFFMHYEDGDYRDEFIAYLSDIYSKDQRVRARPRSLETLTENPFKTLDQQYRDYISQLDTGLNLQSPRPER